MWKRVAYSFLGLILAFLAPWWLTLVWAIGGAIWFPWFLEMVVFAGFFYDVLYGGSAVTWFGHMTHTLISIAGLAVVMFIKRQIDIRM